MRFFDWFFLFALLFIPLLAQANDSLIPLELSIHRLNGDAHYITDEGKAVLRLVKGGWAEVGPPVALNEKVGTISFRIKPLWNDQETSHPFISMRWRDAKGGYLVISQGWWEAVGKHRLYFVFNNEEFAHCSVTCELATGEWSEVTVTWRSGPGGYCRLYVNGDRLAQTMFTNVVNSPTQGPLFIGSDRGTSLANGRKTDALFAGLRAWDKALTDMEVEQFYVTQVGNEALAREQKANWNKRFLNRGTKSEPPRDASGLLRESRVIFDNDMEWATSRQATDRIIAKIKKAGFNVYIPCVWMGANTLYPTSLARMAASLTKRDDPLAYLIAQAHLNGIEVHPWFTVVRREGGEFPQFAEVGTPADAYDVHNPRFRKFIVALMLDVVKRYPVDGVNLDMIRSMGNCTGESCRSGYFRFTGRDLLADIIASVSSKEAAIHLSKWNESAVRAIVADFSKEARRLRPRLIVSVDSSLLSDFFLSQGNDAVSWANSGLVDVVFHMDYEKCPDWRTASAARNQLRDGSRMVMLLSNYDILDHGVIPYDGRLITDFVRLARSQRWSGIAFYHRPHLSGEQVKELSETVFQERARTMW